MSSISSRKLTFNTKYLLLFLLILFIELFIGFFVHDAIIRPYIGDLLVVILIYYFVRIFLQSSYWKIALFTFAFACLVELGQYLDMVTILGLKDNKVARVLIGTSFSWIDILAYFAGFLVIIWVESRYYGVEKNLNTA